MELYFSLSSAIQACDCFVGFALGFKFRKRKTRNETLILLVYGDIEFILYPGILRTKVRKQTNQPLCPWQLVTDCVSLPLCLWQLLRLCWQRQLPANFTLNAINIQQVSRWRTRQQPLSCFRVAPSFTLVATGCTVGFNEEFQTSPVRSLR